MALFKSPTPKGIAGSIAALLSSSSQLSGSEIMEAAKARSSINHQTALAEKAMQEVEKMKQRQRMQNDPNRQNEYVAHAGDMSRADAERLRGSINGESVPLPYPNDEQGNPLPRADYVRPDVTPEQEGRSRAAMMSLLANQMGTGDTNAEQLQDATIKGIIDKVRTRAAAMPNAADQNQAMAPYRQTARQPFQLNAAGASINRETGEVKTDNPLASETIANIVAQAALRNSQAKTEGSKQVELGTRSNYNTAHVGQAKTAAGASGAAAAASRALATLRGTQNTELSAGRSMTGAGGGRSGGGDPVLREQRLTSLAQKKWGTLSRNERKQYTSFSAYFEKVKSDFEKKSSGGSIDINTEHAEAAKAISEGRDPAAVRARFKQRTGIDFAEDDDE